MVVVPPARYREPRRPRRATSLPAVDADTVPTRYTRKIEPMMPWGRENGASVRR